VTVTDPTAPVSAHASNEQRKQNSCGPSPEAIYLGGSAVWVGAAGLRSLVRRRPPVLVLAAALVAPLLVVTQAEGQTEARPVAQPRSIALACPADQIQEDGFADVPATNVHEAAIDCTVHWRVASGRTAMTYGPSSSVSRGQMASFIARLLDRSGAALPAASRDWFGDDGSSAHQDSINRLAEAGIVGGKRPGVYAPQDAVTRAQMAAFLRRAYDHRAQQGGQPALPEGGDHFPDDDTSPLRGEIDRAAAAGFAGGYPDGTYRPGLPVARDQMSAFLARVLDLVVQNGMASVPPGPRTLTATGWQPYASVGPVTLHAPGDVVEVVGFHESGHDGAQPQQSVAGAPVRSMVLPSRNRGTHPQGAADIVVDPSREVRSPVSGRVVRGGSYVLYCKHTDNYLVVEPDARPGWEVKVLHFEGLRVAVGARVEAGVTVIGSRARLLPFRSQVDEHTVAPHWPHVHVEVVDPSIPDRPGSGPGC
jgi:hypothetical protein